MKIVHVLPVLHKQTNCLQTCVSTFSALRSSGKRITYLWVLWRVSQKHKNSDFFKTSFALTNKMFAQIQKSFVQTCVSTFSAFRSSGKRITYLRVLWRVSQKHENSSCYTSFALTNKMFAPILENLVQTCVSTFSALRSSGKRIPYLRVLWRVSQKHENSACVTSFALKK